MTCAANRRELVPKPAAGGALRKAGGPLFLAATLGMAAPAGAITFSHTGQIKLLRAHVSTIQANADWLAVENTPANNCGDSAGFVVLRLRDDSAGERQYAMALSAAVAGLDVMVTINDAHRDSGGYCFLQHIEIRP